MNYRYIVFINVFLLVSILCEPLLFWAVNPVTIYLINVVLAIILLFALIILFKQLKNEENEKEMIALTAHQLSAPLASIKWSLEMLLNGDFGRLSEEQKIVVKRAFEKDDQLIYLIDDLLNASKIDDKKFLLDKKLCSIEEIAVSAADFYKAEIEKKKIKFRLTKLSEKIPLTMADEQKIKLAVQNLFDNAIKYTPAGGEITASIRNLGKYIEFRIKDSGIGILKSQQNRIFNKFFRGKNAIKHDPMGYGLGLFFVKNIISAHGGKVWFKSKNNEGSTFYLTLPVRKQLHKKI
jgi:signal transduction histidine kinase